MSVRVTLTVDVGEGPARSTHIFDVRVGGDNDRFAADQTVVGTLRALASVLARMPERQHEMKGPGGMGERRWPLDGEAVSDAR